MKATIYDIARKAGVSTATVSKVLNNTGRIGEKTRKRILEISRELNYQPNVLASALTGKKTYTIGLLIPDLVNPFFAELARNVEDRAHERGFSVMICNTDNDMQKEVKYAQLLRQKSVDGIIVATGVRNDALLKELIDQKVPVALAARDMSVLAASTVLVDDFAGGYSAASHLLELGHRKIAVIAENLNIPSSKERVRGVRCSLEEAGVMFDESLVVQSDFSVSAGKEAAMSLLQRNKDGTTGNVNGKGDGRPTAIFACNDVLAIGALQAARNLGIRVPEELSVVGFDNTYLARITDPALTTVAQPIQAMGHQVVDLIAQEIDQANVVKQRVILLPELIVRQSTARVKL